MDIYSAPLKSAPLPLVHTDCMHDSPRSSLEFASVQSPTSTFSESPDSSRSSSPRSSLKRIASDDNLLKVPQLHPAPRRRGSSPLPAADHLLRAPPKPKRLRSDHELGSGIPSPPPPLFRPTTFWRNTPRSALYSPAYSPSFHLIRRSTFIAAGLENDKPTADLSALCVEFRTPPPTLLLLPDVDLATAR